MSFLGKNTGRKRQIIPRWYTYRTALHLGDLFPIKKLSRNTNAESFHFQRKLDEWRENRHPIFAVDLVGTALILQERHHATVIDAANFILQHSDSVSSLALEAANAIKNSPTQIFADQSRLMTEKSQFFSWIAKLKKDLRLFPADPIKWADLAFFYTLIGQVLPARKCIFTALALAGDNRFILRSAARFFLHTGEPDIALGIIRSSEVSKYDPWVIAPEIAISESYELQSKRVIYGKKLLESASKPGFAFSELAGTIGTLELSSGATKKAKKLFNFALMEPTENTVAQAISIGSELSLSLPTMNRASGPLYEAQARQFHKEGKYNEAIAETWKWLKFQPFSSVAATYGSYVATVQSENYEEAIKMVEFARMASPNEFLLLNNQAFAFANLGKTKEAETVISLIDQRPLLDSDRAILSATKGIISFRTGDIAEGRRYYAEAISKFSDLKSSTSEALATYFMAREEERIRSGLHENLYKKALAVAKVKTVEDILNQPMK
jgi:tetratricopeptide (TPR) repeat protein